MIIAVEEEQKGEEIISPTLASMLIISVALLMKADCASQMGGPGESGYYYTSGPDSHLAEFNTDWQVSVGHAVLTTGHLYCLESTVELRHKGGNTTSL